MFALVIWTHYSGPLPQNDCVIAGTDEGKVVNISPDLAAVWEEDFVMSEMLILVLLQ